MSNCFRANITFCKDCKYFIANKALYLCYKMYDSDSIVSLGMTKIAYNKSYPFLEKKCPYNK